VDSELPSGGGAYDHPVNNHLWVALAEKAYAEANAVGIVTSHNVGVGSYDALNNGGPAWALQAITGQPASHYSINPSNIATAWNQGKLIVLGTGSPTNSYIVGNHEYAVVGYNASSSQPFEIFNPWGAVKYNPDGTYSALTPSTVVAGTTYWAPGHQNTRYGLFYATADFLSQNFSGQSFGAGNAPGGPVDEMHGLARPAHQALADGAATGGIAPTDLTQTVAAFLFQNFSGQSFGAGNAPGGPVDEMHGLARPAHRALADGAATGGIDPADLTQTALARKWAAHNRIGELDAIFAEAR
jgi:hypothetical protein